MLSPFVVAGTFTCSLLCSSRLKLAWLETALLLSSVLFSVLCGSSSSARSMRVVFLKACFLLVNRIPRHNSSCFSVCYYVES
jgi:hypothetical protein